MTEEQTNTLFEKIFGLNIQDSLALASAEKEYTKLLSDEREEVIRYASAHGWKSSRHERGVELRKIIFELRSKKAE